MRLDLGTRDMHPHRVAVVAFLAQDCVAPKPGDLGLMLGPVTIRHIKREDRAQLGMGANADVKQQHNPVDLWRGDVKAFHRVITGRDLGFGLGKHCVVLSCGFTAFPEIALRGWAGQ